MGGYGSGHWYRWSKKPTTSDLKAVSITKLKKWGCLKEGQFKCGQLTWSWCDEVRSTIGYSIFVSKDGESYFRPRYTNTDTKEEFDYKVQLVPTNPHYGGVRWWFRCPNCRKKCGLLYLGSRIMACRKCYGLSYESSNQSYADRHTNKAFKIAESLGMIGNLLDGFYGEKPKGMHWRTYNKKLQQLKECEDRSLTGTLAWIERFS